jgi:hypothetical protein
MSSDFLGLLAALAAMTSAWEQGEWCGNYRNHGSHRHGLRIKDRDRGLRVRDRSKGNGSRLARRAKGLRIGNRRRNGTGTTGTGAAVMPPASISLRTKNYHKQQSNQKPGSHNSPPEDLRQRD